MSATGKWAKRAVWATFAATLTIGCNPLQTAAFIFHKDDKLPAQYPFRPKDGPTHDKDVELKILVLSHQRPGLNYEFAGADGELTTMIAKLIPVMAKENKEKLAVIPPAQLATFKTANPNWSKLPAATIGKKLGADYVLEVHLGNVSVYQPGSGNQIYEGRGEVFVDVYDVAAGAGVPLHKTVLQYTYPKTGMIAAGDVPLSRFKQQFLERLAIEISEMHIDHAASDGIAAGR